MRMSGCVGGAALLTFTAMGCGGSKVMVPPRLDLVPHQRVALVTFTVENAKGSLNQFATQRFAEEALAAQAGIEILELGEQEWLLEQTGERRYGPASARAIGEEHDVPVVFTGHMIVSNVKPRAAFDFPRVEAGAEVDVSLSVRLLSTGSGGTLWSNSARATADVAHLSMDGGVPIFGGRDPQEAYGELVDFLIYEVTRDLRPTWVRQ